jgi:hypothetical protein
MSQIAHPLPKIADPAHGPNKSDLRARRLVSLAFAKYRAAPADIRQGALAMIGKWETERTCLPWYPQTWRSILAMPVDQAEQVVLADTDVGQMLRASAPFAGIFTSEEMIALRQPDDH